MRYDCNLDTIPATEGGRAGIAARIARFRGEDSGAVIVFSLFLLITMMLVAGLAIDFMRYEMVRTQLQSTSDRAVLAAASLDQTQAPKDVVKDYFVRAGLGDYYGGANVTETQTSGSYNFRNVKALAGAAVSPIFLNLLGFEDMPLYTYSEAEEGISDVEISMVLDVSGSMGWTSSYSGNTKLYDLQEAAKDFVYNMQCNPAATRASGSACTVEYGKVSISMVPYAEQVTAGKALLDQYNVTDEHQSSYCVDFTDDDFASAALSTTDLLQRTGHFDPWTGYDNWNGKWTAPGSWVCPTAASREITPFGDSFTDLYTRIDALTAGGNTSIDVGMKWGTALLDPGTQSVVTNLTTTKVDNDPATTETVVDPVFDGRPYAYGQPRDLKVVILMTDGQNTSQHSLLSGYREGTAPVWHYTKSDPADVEQVYSIYKAENDKYHWTKAGKQYGKNYWNKEPFHGQEACPTEDKYKWKGCYDTGKTDGTPYQLEFPGVWEKITTAQYEYDMSTDTVDSLETLSKNDRLSAICRAARDQNIVVYTIGFEVPTQYEAVMTDCATTENYYFSANGLNISEVFGAIASSINKLRLKE